MDSSLVSSQMLYAITEIHCNLPEEGSQSIITTVDMEFMGKATYKCNTGYIFVSGNDERMCVQNTSTSIIGAWTGNPLVCERE